MENKVVNQPYWGKTDDCSRPMCFCRSDGVTNPWSCSSYVRTAHQTPIFSLHSICGSLQSDGICPPSGNANSIRYPASQGSLWTSLWIICHKGKTISCQQWKVCWESIHQGCSTTRANNIILQSQCTFSERNCGKTHLGFTGCGTSNDAARNHPLATSTVNAPLAVCNENGKWCDECGADKKGWEICHPNIFRQ